MLPGPWFPFWFTGENRPAALPGMNTGAWWVPRLWGQWLPVLWPICPHPTARPTQWPVLRAAQAVNKAGPSFLGTDLLFNGIDELRRNDALMAHKRGFSLPRSWNICFLDPLSKTLLILSRKVHQPPGFNILWHGTILLPATNTSLKRRWDLQG